MFSYYGTKARLAPHYPVPRYDTIVCENEGADWLPFKPLASQQGMSKKQVEVIWLKS